MTLRLPALALGLLLLAAGPAGASTFWAFAAIASVAASAGVGGHRVHDGHTRTGWTATLEDRPVTLTVKLAEHAALKAVRVHLGPLPQGVRVTVAFSADDVDYRTLYQLDGPEPGGYAGVMPSDWLEGRFIRLTFERLEGQGPVQLRVNEIDVFVEG